MPSVKTNTIYDVILNSAKSYGDQTAITYVQSVLPKLVDHTISYRELLANVNRTAHLVRHLLALSEDSENPTPKNKKIVSLLIPNIPQAQYLLWGIESVAIANPLNPLLNEDALYELMLTSETELIFALGPNPHTDIWEKVEKVAARLPNNPKCVSVLTPASASERESLFFDELLPQHCDQNIPEKIRPNADDIAAYFHTGGTTGTPKLALHTHANQVCTARAFTDAMAVEPGEAYVNGLPLFHVAGSTVNSLGCFASGANMLLPTLQGFRNQDVIKQHWQLVDRYKVVVSGGIPTSVASMIKIPIGNADISSLRYMVAGGASTTSMLCSDVKRATGLSLHTIYGMTECAGAITMPNVRGAAVPGSAGFINPERDLEIRIDALKNNPGQVGEICVRGPLVFPGYLNDTHSALDNGWLRTGDLGYIDENHFLFITGRIKDIIIRSGHNIDPVAIESCLESHPAVSMAAAVGRPDEYAGEVPVVYVELHQGQSASEGELHDFTVKNISERPACPKQVFIVNALPLTAVGKLHKPTLRAMAAKAHILQCVAEKFPHQTTTVEAEQLKNGSLKVVFRNAGAIADFCTDLARRIGVTAVIK
jgi:fatty-acyl-CoA synthase